MNPFTEITSFVKNVSWAWSAARSIHSAKRRDRYYDGLKSPYAQNGWQLFEMSINHIIRSGLSGIRKHVRSLYRNNPWVRSYKLRSRANIIGSEGFVLQMLSKLPGSDEYNEIANDIIEEGFKEFGKKENFSLSKRLSFYEFQLQAVDYVKREGEYLAVVHTHLPPSVSKFGCAVEPVEVSEIDDSYNEDLKNGEVIINGIGVNEYRQIINIYLRDTSVRSEIYGSSESITSKRRKIPFKNIIYYYDWEYINQTRAVSPLANVLVSLGGTDNWENVTLKNANYTARKFGVIYKTAEDAGDFTGGGESTEGATPGKYMDTPEGIIEELPYGYQYQNIDPKFPTEQHSPFLKSMLRKIAAGLGLSYSQFANDLSEANFSSIRHEVQGEREYFLIDQKLFELNICRPLVDIWLRYALMSGALEHLSISEYARLNKQQWQGRRWAYIDPLKDIQTDLIAVSMGWKTNTQIAAERGSNYAENLKQIAREEKMQKEIVGRVMMSVKNLKVSNEENTSDESAGEKKKENNRSHLELIMSQTA